MPSNITIIGTSHISKQSIDSIKKAFSTTNFDFVCVELDEGRYHALVTKQKPSFGFSALKQVGLQGYLFALFGHFLQKKLGDIVGTNPGGEMLAAVELARKNNGAVVFIDRDLRITLQRFSKKFSFKEKMRLFWDVARSPFPGQKKMKIDLSKTPKQELIVTLLTAMKDRYPNLYGVLVEERNQIMARKIFVLSKKFPEKKILAVMGAGHEFGVRKELERLAKSKDVHVV